MKQEPWQEDKAWADQCLGSIRKVIQRVGWLILEVNVASDEQDQKYATDYFVTVSSGGIACRVRRLATCKEWRDLTLRWSRPSGAETEFSKILKGFARWYLYAWADEIGNFEEWMLIDLDKVRSRNLLSRGVIRTNKDKTTFWILPSSDLHQHDCLIDFKLNHIYHNNHMRHQLNLNL